MNKSVNPLTVTKKRQNEYCTEYCPEEDDNNNLNENNKNYLDSKKKDMLISKFNIS